MEDFLLFLVTVFVGMISIGVNAYILGKNSK